MKLLHAVIRFCAAGTAIARGGLAVPQDFRVTVPAPLNQAHDAEVGPLAERPAMVVHSTNENPNPATVLAPQH